MKNILAYASFISFKARDERPSQNLFTSTLQEQVPHLYLPILRQVVLIYNFTGFWKIHFNASHVKIPEELTTLTTQDSSPFLSLAPNPAIFTQQHRKNTQSLLSFAAWQIARWVKTTQLWLTFGAD